MSSNKQTIWITGASSGIGRALALQFALANTKLIISSRNKEALEKVKQLCIEKDMKKSDILVLPFDVTNESQLPSIAEQAKCFSGKLDLLINNAGISQRSSLLDTEIATYRKLFDVDVFAPIALTKLVIPIMIEQGSGHIAVTSSVAGKIGVPFRTGYCAAKHALMGFFDALRSEVAQHNIEVSTITPGYIKTDVSKNAITGDGSTFGKTDASIENGMQVDACAKIICKGLRKGKNEIVVGEGLEMIILKLKRYLPNLVFRIMEGQYKKIAASNRLD